MTDPRLPTNYLYTNDNPYIVNTQPPLPPARMAQYYVSYPQQPVLPILRQNSSPMPGPWQPTEQLSQQLPPYPPSGVAFQNVSPLQQPIQTLVTHNPNSMHMPSQPSYPSAMSYSTGLPCYTQHYPELYHEENTSTGPVIGSTGGRPPPSTEFCEDQQNTELFEVEGVEQQLNPDAKAFLPRMVVQEIYTPHPCPPGPEAYLPPDGSASLSIEPGANNETETNASPELKAKVESMPDMDIFLLIPSESTSQKPDIDSDMKHLYCLSQQQPQLSHKAKKQQPISIMQNNSDMFYDTKAKGYKERMKIIDSLSKEVNRDLLSEMMPDTSQSFSRLCKGANMISKKIPLTSPEHIIYMSVMPYLPHTHNKQLTFSVPSLPGYSIPFSTDFFYLADTMLKKTKKKTKDKESYSPPITDQLMVTTSTFWAMRCSFEIIISKLKKTKNIEKKNNIQWDLLIHSKYIVHILLTSLLLLEHEETPQNLSFIIHTILFFIAHIKLIHSEKDIAENAYLELTRALICFLNHSSATSVISSEMVNTKSTETRPSRKTQNEQETDTDPGITPKAKDLISVIHELIIEALNFFSNKPKFSAYYFSIFNTLYKSPFFGKELLSDNPATNNEIIKELSNFIGWMHHNLKNLSYYDRPLSDNMAIIQETHTWILKLSQLIATLAGRTPEKEKEKEITNTQWLNKNLIQNQEIETSDKTDTKAKLKSLAIDIEALREERVKARLEEGRISREFEKEIDTWAKKMDQLSNLSKQIKVPKSNQKTNQKPDTTQESDEAAPLKSIESTHHTEEKSVPGITNFTQTLTSLCDTLDATTSFEILKKITEDKLTEHLIHPAHKVYCFLEIGLHLFHKNCSIIIPTAKSMEKAQETYKKLVTLQPPAEESITHKHQAIQWLSNHFSQNELTLRNIALLARNTDVDIVTKAKERLRNSLLFLGLSIKYGHELMNEIKKTDCILQGELDGSELISHFDLCHELIAQLNGYNENLHQKLITYELPSLKIRLLEKLRLYGRNSFTRPADHSLPSLAASPRDEKAKTSLSKMKQNKEKYQSYNRNLDDSKKVDTSQLLHDFTVVHNGLKSFLESNTQGNLAQSQFSMI